MRRIWLLTAVLVTVLFGCSTAENRTGGPAISMPQNVQIGGDISLIGGVYKTYPRSEPRP
ncbi:MAG TPA: hypothetical protein PLQ35_02590 [bacterium]|nr:hypothetical protein [bacterium]HQL61161.1 hypothetical protein [bacterium]